MSRLVKAACKLNFTEHELADFFGGVGEWDGDDCYYSWDLSRDGLRLLFTVFPLDGGVYTDVYRDGISEPIVRTRLGDCTHACVVPYGSHRCLEIGRPEHPTSDADVPLVWGLRLFVEPHFRVEFLHDLA